MSNVIISAYKGVLLGDAAISGFAVPNWESDTITLAGIDTADDTVNPQTDQDLADITGAAIVASANLATVTVATSGANSTIDAADLTFSAVSGDQYENYVLYQNTGTAGTSLLLVHFDTFTSGMPVTPNGGDIVNAFHASGIVQF